MGNLGSEKVWNYLQVCPSGSSPLYDVILSIMFCHLYDVILSIMFCPLYDVIVSYYPSCSALCMTVMSNDNTMSL